MDDITRAIAGLTARPVARRFTLENERMSKMDRLSEKMAKAAGVVGRISSKIEARADSLIARESALEQRTEQVFTPHESILDDAEKGLDAVERKLALLSNDPLQASGSSPEPPPEPPPPLPPSRPAGSAASTEPHP